MISKNIKKTFEGLVPELLGENVVISATQVTIPKGGRWEVWDGGQNLVQASTLAIYDAVGSLVTLKLRTRPRGKLKLRKRSSMLPVRVAKPLAKTVEKRDGSQFNQAQLTDVLERLTGLLELLTNAKVKDVRPKGKK